MTRSLAVGALAASTLLVGVAYAAALVTGAAPAWASWCFMIGTMTAMLAMIVLGAVRGRGGVGKLAVPFAATYALLLVAFGAALALPAEMDAGVPLVLGLPRRAAIVLYGVGAMPLFLLPLAYAFTFDSMTLSEADLARVAEARRAREAAEAARGASATRDPRDSRPAPAEVA